MQPTPPKYQRYPQSNRHHSEQTSNNHTQATVHADPPAPAPTNQRDASQYQYQQQQPPQQPYYQHEQYEHAGINTCRIDNSTELPRVIGSVRYGTESIETNFLIDSGSKTVFSTQLTCQRRLNTKSIADQSIANELGL
jgi:hypothetical protein